MTRLTLRHDGFATEKAHASHDEGWLEYFELWAIRFNVGPEETLRASCSGFVPETVDVRATLAAIEAEHAPAGMVYRTDAAISKRVRVAFEVPREPGPAIVYPLAPVARSKHPEAAAALVRYLTGPQAVAVYERFGFVVLVRR